MYATNRNSLSDKTVHILRVITGTVRKPFVIPGIVDRMAAMLNYVLKLRVGKKNKNLKVYARLCIKIWKVITALNDH